MEAIGAGLTLDVCRFQILTSKVNPCTERIKGINYDFKYKKTL